MEHCPDLRDFNPPTPCGVGRKYDEHRTRANWISIHAPRGGRDYYSSLGAAGEFLISIHAPRGGARLERFNRLRRKLMISIHAPRGGRDRAARYRMA